MVFSLNLFIFSGELIINSVHSWCNLNVYVKMLPVILVHLMCYWQTCVGLSQLGLLSPLLCFSTTMKFCCLISSGFDDNLWHNFDKPGIWLCFNVRYHDCRCILTAVKSYLLFELVACFPYPSICRCASVLCVLLIL
jgi:hypothetical protein